MTLRRFTSVVLALLALFVAPARATSIQELVRLDGQGESTLQGFGLVIGLPGTGDSGKDLAVARPLAALLESQGNPVGSFDELAQSRSVALVVVTCSVGRSGARPSDRFDVTVAAINNPKSLAGGQLFLTPLRGPLPGQGVFAIAEGPLVLEGPNPVRGRVRGGAHITRAIGGPVISRDGAVRLIIDPNFSGWTTAQLLANTINQHRIGFDDTQPEIAYALDERTVRVQIPIEELPDPANFIADILGVRFDASLLDLPARVVVNERTGVIVVSGDAEISPVSISHNDLVISTVTPPPPPLDPDAVDPPPPPILPPPDRASVADLLNAFKQLGVGVREQIAILTELHRGGNLHAELVVN